MRWRDEEDPRVAAAPPSALRRWLVLGAGGAGKTRLAVELGRVLELPVIHLDRHYWGPGWVEPSHAEFDETVVRLASGLAWTIDGNYSRTLHLRSRTRCPYGAIFRSRKYDAPRTPEQGP